MSVNNNLAITKELSYDLKVLYAEDEKEIRDVTSELLKIFFKDIAVAVDGYEAKNMLNSFKPDILITDIQMPNMDGLELIEYAKENFEDLSIIITTAFSNQDYIFRSFDLGVSQYLIKPIKQESLIQVIYNTSKIIDNGKKAKELEAYKVRQMIGFASEHLVDQILGSLKSPCIIYTDDEVRYFNDAFKNLTNEEEINSLFDKKDGFLSNLNEYSEDDLATNRVSVSKQEGRKVYKIIRNNINIDEIVQTSKIYIFVDITLEEYQKVKIKSYTEILESIVFKVRYHQEQPKEELADVIENETIQETKNKEKLVINDQENEILRRSHTHKATAQEYVDELDQETLSELQELDELDQEFAESIYILKDESNLNGIKHMAQQLQKYAHEISLLFEFKDLSYAIESLSKLFNTIDENKLNEKNLKKILIMLDGIKDDLATWRRVIFTDRSAVDIHYLDSSLFSACLQIELLLSDEIKEMESEEDEFILF